MYLRSKGINVNVHYIPIHMQPYFKKWDLNLEIFQIQKDTIQRQ